MNLITTRFRIIYFLCLFFFTTASAQLENVEWVTATGGSSSNKFPQETVMDSQGNVYMTGSVNGLINFGDITLSSTNSNDIFIVKYDNSGNVVWAKSFNTGPQDESGYGIAVDYSDNVYFTGIFKGPSLTVGNITLTNQSFYFSNFIIKMDSNGNAIWGKTIKTWLYNDNLDISDIVIDSTGAVIVSGNYYGAVIIDQAELPSTGRNSFVVKFSNDGNLIWYKYGFGPSSIEAIAVDSNDNIYITGHHIGEIEFDNISLPSVGTFTTKFNSNGTVLWAKAGTKSSLIGGIQDMNSFGLDVDDSGNVVITGVYHTSPITFGSFSLPASPGEVNCYVVKYNTDGDVLWAKSTSSEDGPINFGTKGARAKFDNFGNVYIYGYLSSTTNFDDIILTHHEPSIYSFLVRYNMDGNVDWAKKITDFSPFYGQTYVSLLLNNNEIFISGVCRPNASFGVKTALDGGIFLAKMASPTLDTDEFLSQIKFNLSPNPVKDIVNVNCKDNITELNIYNALGQCIKSYRNLNVKDYSADLSFLSSGYYIIEAVSQQSKLQEKIVKL